MGKSKKDERKKKKNGKNGRNGHNGGADELIHRLNRALSLEYAATIQYLQQQCAVKGKERQQFAPFFAASSGESHLHAQNLGNKIAALGGVPTIEPAKIRQGKNLAEMLRYDLDMEREALEMSTSKRGNFARGQSPAGLLVGRDHQRGAIARGRIGETQRRVCLMGSGEWGVGSGEKTSLSNSFFLPHSPTPHSPLPVCCD